MLKFAAAICTCAVSTAALANTFACNGTANGYRVAATYDDTNDSFSMTIMKNGSFYTGGTLYYSEQDEQMRDIYRGDADNGDMIRIVNLTPYERIVNDYSRVSSAINNVWVRLSCH